MPTILVLSNKTDSLESKSPPTNYDSSLPYTDLRILASAELPGLESPREYKFRARLLKSNFSLKIQTSSAPATLWSFLNITSKGYFISIK